MHCYLILLYHFSSPKVLFLAIQSLYRFNQFSILIGLKIFWVFCTSYSHHLGFRMRILYYVLIYQQKIRYLRILCFWSWSIWKLRFLICVLVNFSNCNAFFKILYHFYVLSLNFEQSKQREGDVRLPSAPSLWVKIMCYYCTILNNTYFMS